MQVFPPALLQGCLRLTATGVVLAIVLLVPASRARADDCERSLSLRKRVACWVDRIRAGGEFRPPDPGARAHWRKTIAAMLEGHCEDLELPPALEGYQVEALTDSETGRPLCLLHEAEGHALGWGSFIAAPPSSRPVHLLVPHPVNDVGTAEQAVDIMLGANARSALIAGAARWIDAEGGGCGDRPASDPTHSPHTVFQPTVDALADAAAGELVLQLHGMAETSCSDVDVYLTHGSSQPVDPDGVLAGLRSAMSSLMPDWTVSVPGTDAPSCRLHGSRNVQARLLGGVDPARVCESAPESPSHHFVHVEQKPWARGPEVWVEVLEKTFELDGPH